ncbi:MAG TPA: alpha/beta hydrolase [Mycobacterium sp.]|nr:alpha/beta hydrolase [Mycobacterium sp.]
MLKKSLVALGALLVVLIAVNLTSAKLPAMPAASGEFITLQGKEIHYTERPGADPAVVMVHGLPGSVDDFDQVIARLPGRHVVAVDRPGFGWSRGGWLPFQQQLDVLHDLVARLHLAPAVVVGHSYGGTAALGLAARFPDDVTSLVLAAPAGGDMRADRLMIAQARIVKATEKPVLGELFNMTVGNLVLRASAEMGAREAFDPGRVAGDYVHRLLAVSMTPGNLAALADDRLEFDSVMRWLDGHVGEVRAPVHIVAAQDDKLVELPYVRQLQHALRDAQLTVVDGSHMIVDTHPDVLADQISSAAKAAPR